MAMDGPWLNDLTARDNRYKFNGIERVPDFGLNMDLASFRSYDPAIGRWWQADPLAALAPEQSPYRFGFNSPMNFGDPLGLFETREEAKEYKREHRTGGRVRQLDDGTYAIVNKKSGGFLTKSAEYGVVPGVLDKRGSNVATISPYNPTLWDRMAESNNFFVSMAYNQADVFYAGFQALNPLDTRVMHLGHGEVTQNDAQDLSVGVSLTALGGVVGAIGNATNVAATAGANPNLWKVGRYSELKKLSKGLDDLAVHHVGQGQVMKNLIAEYVYRKGPSIIVPKKGHTSGKGIVSTNTKGFSNARDLLARDIRELRRVYGSQGIPTKSLQELIELNKKMYPKAFMKK